MVERHSACVDCGARVVLTSATPVVRAGAVRLQCETCSGGRTLEDDDDYDAIIVSVPDEAEEPATADAVAKDGVYGARQGSVSGAIESKGSAPRPDATPLPVIITDLET